MNKKLISFLLKLVAIFIGAVFVFAGAYIVPAHMRFLQRFVPAVGPLFVGIVAYINLAFAPVYLCLALAWRVFTTVGKDEAFCAGNVGRFKTAALLALVDVALVVAFAVFIALRLPVLMDTLLLISTLCLVFVGFSAAIVCFAAATLLSQAVELKQELDLTV